MRATAFAPEVARLLGVRVPRMLTLGWALAGLVGALAAMLVLPTGLGLYPQAMEGVFVLGFTGAIVGGLDSPVGAVVGGVVTGLVLSYVSGYLGSDLTLVGRAGVDARGSAGASERSVQPGAREAGVMRAADWWTRRPTVVRHLALLIVGAALVLAVTAWFSDYHDYELATLGAYLCAIAGLTVLTGTNGQVSLGHAAFMAIGGYTVALLQNRFADAGVTGVWVLPVSLLLGTVVTAVAGTLFGVAAARLRGPYLAGATLALGVALPSIASHFSGVFKGDQGLSVPFDPPPSALGADFTLEHWQAWISLLAALLVMFFLGNLQRIRRRPPHAGGAGTTRSPRRSAVCRCRACRSRPSPSAQLPPDWAEGCSRSCCRRPRRARSGSPCRSPCCPLRSSAAWDRWPARSGAPSSSSTSAPGSPTGWTDSISPRPGPRTCTTTCPTPSTACC